MITINGVKLAESNKEAIASLFIAGGTASLFAKRQKRRIVLSYPNGEPFGVVSNGVIGTATRLDNGKVWYSYGWPKELGIEPEYGAVRDMARQLAVSHDATGPIYKAG